MKLNINKNGEVILEDNDYDLKISNSRDILIKNHIKKDKEFKSLNSKIPYGLSKLQKKTYLLSLHDRIQITNKEVNE